tara:strand:- start:270 stop:485 length:216 start_codon:yes stop_codon:yes gene_type:complete
MPGGRTKRQQAHDALDKKVKDSKTWKFISSIGDGVKSVGKQTGKQIRKAFKSKKNNASANNKKGKKVKLKF